MLSENLKKKPKNRTDTAVLKKTDTENRTDLEKIPSEIPKTDTELKNRHRPKSNSDYLENDLCIQDEFTIPTSPCVMTNQLVPSSTWQKNYA
jgi:hypothetical protein